MSDDPDRLTFTIAIDEPQVLRPDLSPKVVDDAKRRYYTTVTRRRLHQAKFRDRVLAAYRSSCAICSLRHVELLDAAHIVPDSSEHGEPVVSNGLSLCKIHHAAFDRNILGIRPDLVVQIRPDIMEEVDGPMLKFGLQGFHGAHILQPKRDEDKAEPARLEERFAAFLDAA